MLKGIVASREDNVAALDVKARWFEWSLWAFLGLVLLTGLLVITGGIR